MYFKMGNVNGITVYQDDNFKGQSVSLGVGHHNGGSSYYTNKKKSSQNRFKRNDVSSLKVDPGYGCVLICDDGTRLKFVNRMPTYDQEKSKNNEFVKNPTLDIPSLLDYNQNGHNFNDRVTEIIVFRHTNRDNYQSCYAYELGGNSPNQQFNLESDTCEVPGFLDYNEGKIDQNEWAERTDAWNREHHPEWYGIENINADIDTDTEITDEVIKEPVTENFGCGRKGSYITPCIIMSVAIIIILAIIWYTVSTIGRRVDCWNGNDKFKGGMSFRRPGMW